MDINEAIIIYCYRLAKYVSLTVSEIHSCIRDVIACISCSSRKLCEVDSVNKHIGIDRGPTIPTVLVEINVHIICVEQSIDVNSICEAIGSRRVRSFITEDVGIPPRIYCYDLIISISAKLPVLATRI